MFVLNFDTWILVDLRISQFYGEFFREGGYEYNDKVKFMFYLITETGKYRRFNINAISCSSKPQKKIKIWQLKKRKTVFLKSIIQIKKIKANRT